MPLGYRNSKRLFLERCFGSEDSCHGTHAEVDGILEMCGGTPVEIVFIASAIASRTAKKVDKPWQEMMKPIHSARVNFHSVEELTMEC